MKLKHGIFVKEIMCLFAKKHPSEVTDCKAFQQNTDCIFFILCSTIFLCTVLKVQPEQKAQLINFSQKENIT